LDVAEGLNYLHANYTIHGDLKGVGNFSVSFRAALTTFDQPNILVDHNGNARLTDFGLTSIVRGLNSVLATPVKGYTEAWAAPEVLEKGDKATSEADIFAFGMVVIEVGPRASQNLVSAVAGWTICLTFKSRARCLQEGTRSPASQHQLSFR